MLRGVRWVSTAGHGGMGVADGLARKLLSHAAYKEGEKYGGYVWYEEDVAFEILYYEHPEWYPLLEGRPMTDAIKAQLERTVRTSFPTYFRKKQEGFTLPDRPRIGDTIRILKSIPMSKGMTLNAGEEYLVKKFTADKIYLTTPDGYFTARLPIDFYTGHRVYSNGVDSEEVFLQKVASPARVAALFSKG